MSEEISPLERHTLMNRAVSAYAFKHGIDWAEAFHKLEKMAQKRRKTND